MPDVFQWTLPVSVKPPFTEKYLQEECESEQQGKDGVCLSCEKAENYIECSLIQYIQPFRRTVRIYRKNEVFQIMDQNDSHYGKSTEGIHNFDTRTFLGSSRKPGA